MSNPYNFNTIHCICCTDINHSSTCSICIQSYITTQQQILQQSIERRYQLLRKLDNIIQQNNNELFQQYCTKQLYLHECQHNIINLTHTLHTYHANHKNLQKKIYNINYNQIQQRNKELHDNKYNKLNTLKHKLQQCTDEIQRNRKLHDELVLSLYTTRSNRLAQLNELYPVVRVDNTHCSINGLVVTDMIDLINLQQLPSTASTQHISQSIGASAINNNNLHYMTTCLGYIVFLLQKLAKYCNVTLPHYIVYHSSQSCIYEHSSADTSTPHNNRTLNQTNNTVPTAYNIDDNYKQYLYSQSTHSSSTHNKLSSHHPNKCYQLSWGEIEPSEFRYACQLLGNNARYISIQYGISKDQLRHSLQILPNILILIQHIHTIASTSTTTTTSNNRHTALLDNYPNLATLTNKH